MKLSNYDNPLAALRMNVKNLRVSTDLAKEWMLCNSAVIYCGSIHYFQVKDLGLGVWEVRLLPKEFTYTRIVKDWYILD